MERTRVAGVILMNGGVALINRVGVKKRGDYNQYYTFPGGGLEKGETLEEGAIREVKEELGINVKIKKLLYETYLEKFNQKEYFFLCEYIDGEFGTGDGPEFSNDPKYIDSGKYIPEIIKIEDIKDLNLLPTEMKDILLKFLEENN